MSFRARLAIAAATAVALAVLLASATVYLVVRNQLRGTVDNALRERAAEVQHAPIRAFAAGDRAYLEPGPELGGAPGYFQVVSSDGRTIRPPNESVELPVTGSVLGVASGQRGGFLSDSRVSGIHVRVITEPYAQGYAIQIARPLTEVDHSLGRIRTYLFIIAATGIALAAALGLAVARTALRPVRRLTRATENVRKTGDLSERIEASGTDELSRLAASFNTMLAALEESTRAQQQLVGDASHELRTPLTSLRTNVEVLAGGRELPPDERERLLKDVVEQLDEMTTLVGELSSWPAASSSPGRPRMSGSTSSPQMRSSARGATAQASSTTPTSRRHSSTAFRRASSGRSETSSTTPPSGAPPTARSRSRSKTGRSWSATTAPGSTRPTSRTSSTASTAPSSARGLPGSGLGLAIVRQVAESHGGQVVAEAAEGGGTRISLRLDGHNLS